MFKMLIPFGALNTKDKAGATVRLGFFAHAQGCGNLLAVSLVVLNCNQRRRETHRLTSENRSMWRTGRGQFNFNTTYIPVATWAFVILMALNVLAVALELFNLMIIFTDFLWDQRRGRELTRGCEA